MALAQLATELQDLICLHLDTPDLTNLSATCRGLRKSALAASLQTVNLIWRAESKTQPSLLLLSRTLSAAPELAEHVKHIELRLDVQWTALRRNGTVPMQYTTAGEDITWLRQAGREAGFAHLDGWEDALLSADGGALVALLLSRCESSKSLVLDVHFAAHNPWLVEVLKQHGDNALAPGRSSPLAQLSSVDICCPDEYRAEVYGSTGVPLALFSLLSYSSRLRSLTIAAFAVRHGLSLSPYRLSLCHPRSLSLSRCSASTDILEQVLKRTSQLEELNVDFYLPSSRAYLDLAEFERALNHVQHTLRHLSLRFALFADEALEVEHLWFVIKSQFTQISQFSKLESLKIPLAFLIGMWQEESIELKHTVPSSLQHFTMTDDMFDSHAFHWKGSPIVDLVEDFLSANRASNATAYDTASKSATFEIRGSLWDRFDEVLFERLKVPKVGSDMTWEVIYYEPEEED